MKKIHFILLVTLYIAGFAFLGFSIMHSWSAPGKIVDEGFPYDRNKLDDAQKLTADRTLSRTQDSALYATKDYIRLCDDTIDPMVEEWSINKDGSKEVIQQYREYVSFIDYSYFFIESYFYRASKCDLYVYSILSPRKNGTTTVKVFYDRPTGVEEKSYTINIKD